MVACTLYGISTVPVPVPVLLFSLYANLKLPVKYLYNRRLVQYGTSTPTCTFYECTKNSTELLNQPIFLACFQSGFFFHTVVYSVIMTRVKSIHQTIKVSRVCEVFFFPRVETRAVELRNKYFLRHPTPHREQGRGRLAELCSRMP